MRTALIMQTVLGGRRLPATIATFDFTAGSSGIATLPAGWSLTRATGSGIATVGDWTAGQDVRIYLTGITTDVPRRRTNSRGRSGVLIESTTTNRCLNNRVPSSWTVGATPPASDGAVARPDTTLGAWRENVPSGSYGNYLGPTLSSGTTYSVSSIQRAHAGTAVAQINAYNGATKAIRKALTTLWARVAGFMVAGGSALILPVEGRSIVGGDAADRDVYEDFLQVSADAFAKEPVITAGATATCAGDRLYHSAASQLLDNGRLTIEITIDVTCAWSLYGATVRILTINATNYVDFLASGLINVVVEGVVFQTTVPAVWSADQRVVMTIECGGGSLLTSVQYRVEGGGTTVLGTSYVAQPAIVPGASTFDLCCNGAASELTTQIPTATLYHAGRRPAWASAPVVPTGSTAYTMALASLVTPDLTSSMWSGTNAAPRDHASVADGAPAETGWYYLNRAGNAADSARLVAQLACPPGNTSITFQFDALLPAGVSASTISFGLLIASRASFVAAESTASLTGSVVTYTATFTGLTAGTEYAPCFDCNDATAIGAANQAQAIIGNIRVIPNNGSGIVGGGTSSRYETPPSAGYDHGLDAMSADSTPPRQYTGPSTQSFSFVPGGNKIVLEYCSSNAASPGTYDPISVWQSGALVTTVTPSTQNKVLFSADITVTAGVRVDVTNGPYYQTGNDGGRLRAIHCNDSLATTRTAPPALQIDVESDSIGVGLLATPPSRYGFIPVARRSLTTPIVINGRGFRRLYDIAADAATITATVTAMRAVGVGLFIGTVVLIELSTNDYGGAGGSTPWATVGLFQTQLQNLATAILAADSTVRIVFMTPFSRSSENTVNAAATTPFNLPAVRTAITTVQALFATSYLLRAEVTLLVGAPAEGTHPNNAESVGIAANLVTWLQSTLGVS